MRQHISGLGLALLFLTACSAEGAGTEKAAAGVSASPAPSSSGEAIDLRLAQGGKYLLPSTSGVGNAELASFKPSGNVYTVHIGCRGNGELQLAYRGNEQATRIECNGPVSIGHVYSDPETQFLSVTPNASNVSWSVAVVDGAEKL
ncbi:hypothetical protein [Streptomyces sp. NPDC058623]|uniref:hypothetical protein n=1 Tax=Streptomyces sp. NPDC058623 TaxID=3346563 RepID=UPI003658148D